MVRTTRLVVLVALSLLVTSGVGAAQSLSGDSSLESSSDHQIDLQEDHNLKSQSSADGSANLEAGGELVEQPCPPDQACAAVQSGHDGHAEASAALDTEATVEVDLSGADERPELPSAPQEEPEDEANEEEPDDEEPAPEENDSEEAQSRSRISSYYDGNASIHYNGSADGEVRYDDGFEHEENVSEPEDDGDEEQAPEEEPEDEEPLPIEALPQELVVEHEQAYTYRQDIEAYVKARAQESLSSTHDLEATPVEHELPVEGGAEAGEGSFELDLRSTFKASTRPFTSAATQVSDQVIVLVDQVRGMLQGSAQTEVAAEAATQVEAVTGVAGQADVASGATAVVDGTLAEATEVPEVEPPAAELATESQAQSETTVSSSLTGDLGFGL